MSQPVKLSDALVTDARMAATAVERSIAGQVEFWAKIGRAIEPLLEGTHAIALCQAAAARPLSECLQSVDSPAGRRRLSEFLRRQPWPHYEPHATQAGILVRIDASGKRTAGRFVNRKFEPLKANSRRR